MHPDRERRRQLLRRRDDPVALVADLETVAPALVDGVVAANRVRVLRAEPGEPEAVADLLVGGRREDQVAGRLEALADERGEGNCVRGDVALHVERAAAPHLALPHLAGERRHRPLGRVGQDDVRVTEEEQGRAVAAPRYARDEVRPLGHPRVRVATRAVRLEVLAQELGRGRLVSGRVSRVHLDQAA